MKEPQNPETPGETIKTEPGRVFVGGLSSPAPQPGPAKDGGGVPAPPAGTSYKLQTLSPGLAP